MNGAGLLIILAILGLVSYVMASVPHIDGDGIDVLGGHYELDTPPVPQDGTWFCEPCGSVHWLPVGPGKAVCSLCERPMTLIASPVRLLGGDAS